MSMAASPIDLERTLHERFDLEQFRPGQREVIEQVLGRRDVLCVMPTGGGKSLCYQLPALLLEGLTLVVSPLIALMKDQVDALTQRGLRATLINSTLDPAEQRARLAEVEAGRYDLVYVAPERFRSGRFVEAMARIKPALLAVDEAHCISEWGHDFRPDYARLGLARRAMGMPPCIALTATATDLVRRDIADQLDLHQPALFVTGFDRPNLTYRVVGARKDPDKLAALAEALDANPGSAIVYASSRKRCEDVGRFLEYDLRRPTVIYHAGLSREERNAAQDRFMSGDAEIVVATNAFGMGVDKPDIRSVVHFNMPGTLEAYYQEAGRSGRDGLPAECVLLYAPGDRFLQELFIENEYPPPELIYRVYEFLRGLDADPIELTQAEIREAIRTDLSEGAVGSALKILEGAGALERFRPRENMAIVRINAEPDEPSLADRLAPQAHIRRIVLLGVEGLVNRRFGETVYFQPDEFAAALGLDRAALTRALKNLAAELPIDYIPPFRGNAVRVLDRQKRSRDLTIDFTSLAQRKGQEYEKLERMLQYAQTSRCRRAYILGYFGDERAERCGRCDNCGGEGGPGASARPVDTPAGREVILKVLSGVARAKGRFGKTTVAQMLMGSSSGRMERGGLANLSTYGILAKSGFTRQEVAEIIEALTLAGFAESQEVGTRGPGRGKPVVSLSGRGWEWLRSRGEAAAVTLSLPDYLVIKIRNGGLERLNPRGDSHATVPSDRPRGTPTVAPEGHRPGDDADGEAPPPTGGDDDPYPSGATSDPLYERLRALRSEWAREAKQPSYCIFKNETLDALVRERPRSPHALANVKGFGPARMERYGSAILAAILEASPASSGGEVGIDEGEGTVPAEDFEGRPIPSPPALPGGGEEQGPPLGSPVKGVARPSTSSPQPSEPGAYVPTEEWTWRLLDRGFTADEAAAIRGLEPSVIVRHANRVARQGRPVPIRAFLAPDRIGRWDAWHRQHDDTPPPDADDAPGLWPLFLECRKATS